MKIVFLSLFFTHVLFISGFALPDTVRYFINLKIAEDGNLKVSCQLPLSPSGVQWQLPAMVPGTYKIYNFGRFIKDIQVQTPGNISVERKDTNVWQFSGIGTSVEFQYTAQHTWNFPGKGPEVFYPAGTRFIKDSFFLFNPYAVCGYPEGGVQIPIKIGFVLPDDFFPATAQKVFHRNLDTVFFVYENYHALADQPVLFSKPETAIIKLKETEVLIALYDPSGVTSARKVSLELKSLLEAQQEYLGGTLPVNTYAFLIYIDPDFNMFGGFGALEHNFSSVYYLPAMEESFILEQIRDIGAHEFFHILTPLSLHSEQIHDFNYQVPEMSRHLWLYEGATEYAASLVQVQYDLIKEDDFIEMIREKITSSEGYNDTLPFTEMSLGVLDKYEDEYQNVYEKGALIALCLDLTLRKYCPNQMSLADLLQQLSQVYGKEKPFKDEDLFSEIEKYSCTEAGDFLKKYVSGNLPLPLNEILTFAGYQYLPEKTSRGFTLGGIELNVNPETGRLMVWSTDAMDTFGKKIKYKPGDEFIKLNGVELNMGNIESVFTEFFEKLKEGDMVEFTLSRMDKKGNSKTIKRKAKMPMVEYTDYHTIRLIPERSDEQNIIRNAWLRKM